jgi:hypothetical protein
LAKYIGTLTSDMRGKVGGIVFSRGRNGTNLRAHAVPVNPATLLQVGVRGTLAASQNAWRLLDGIQKQSWTSFASFYLWTNPLGQAYVPTGLQLWTQAYVNAAAYGTFPPGTWSGTMPVLNPVVGLALTRSGYDLYCYASIAGALPAVSWILYASATIGANVIYCKKTSRRFMAAWSIGWSGEFSGAYVAAFGVLPPIGARLALRAVGVDPVTFVSATPLTLSVPVLS